MALLIAPAGVEPLLGVWRVAPTPDRFRPFQPLRLKMLEGATPNQQGDDRRVRRQAEGGSCFVPRDNVCLQDIEGSTTRWERGRVAMQDAVRRDTIVQATIARRGGHVFKTAATLSSARSQRRRRPSPRCQRQKGLQR